MYYNLVEQEEDLLELVQKNQWCKDATGNYWKIITSYALSFTLQERVIALRELLSKIDRIRKKLVEDYRAIGDKETTDPTVYIDSKGEFFWVPQKETIGPVPDYWALHRSNSPNAISVDALFTDGITRQDLKDRGITTLRELEQHSKLILRGTVSFDRLDTLAQIKQVLKVI